MRLVGLAIYPLKSGAGIALERWPLSATGLLLDRRFMLVDQHGDFITLRGHPKLVTVRAELRESATERLHDPATRPLLGLVRFTRDGVDPLDVSLAPDRSRPLEVQIWGVYVSASLVSEEADAFFSRLCQKPVRLVRFDEPVRRQVDPRFAATGDSVQFADEFPLLVMTTASVRDLSERYGADVSMRRFRPNLVIETDTPFVEDRWSRITVGGVPIDIVKPCGRCVGVNVEPDSGRSAKEPLATLAKYRTANNKVLFGQNAIHRGVGVLSLGDRVEVVTEHA